MSPTPYDLKWNTREVAIVPTEALSTLKINLEEFDATTKAQNLIMLALKERDKQGRVTKDVQMGAVAMSVYPTEFFAAELGGALLPEVSVDEAARPIIRKAKREDLEKFHTGAFRRVAKNEVVAAKTTAAKRGVILRFWEDALAKLGDGIVTRGPAGHYCEHYVQKQFQEALGPFIGKNAYRVFSRFVAVAPVLLPKARRWRPPPLFELFFTIFPAHYFFLLAARAGSPEAAF